MPVQHKSHIDREFIKLLKTGLKTNQSHWGIKFSTQY